MPLYLDTTGNASLAVAICDRCGFKYPIGELMSDPNIPGLRVDAGCKDLFDPHRLPPRKTENIALKYPRPDVPINTHPAGFITQDNNGYIVLEDGTTFLEF